MINPQVVSENEHSSLQREFEGDSRWPQKCAACDYLFVPEDQHQVNYDRLHRGSPDGKLYVLRELPPGACWNADWLCDTEDSRKSFAGPDGKAWCIMMPGGVEWIVYGYPSGPEPRKKWTVQGLMPNITAHPSVNIVGHWHGYVTGGIISEDHEGRTYPGLPRTV